MLGISINHNMAGGEHLPAVNTPDMKIMDIRHTRNGAQHTVHLPWISAIRHAFQKNINGILQQSDGARENDRGDDDGSNRVRRQPAGVADDQSGDDNSH